MNLHYSFQNEDMEMKVHIRGTSVIEATTWPLDHVTQTFQVEHVIFIPQIFQDIFTALLKRRSISILHDHVEIVLKKQFFWLSC